MITIREMTAADRDAVISIHRESIRGLCRDHYTEAEMKTWTDRLTPELFDESVKDENNVGVVATASDAMIGYGFFNAQENELRALYVLPKFTGSGTGRLILARLENLARKKGIGRMTLQSTINAVRFYERLGYQAITSERHQIDEKVSIACVRMEKDL